MGLRFNYGAVVLPLNLTNPTISVYESLKLSAFNGWELVTSAQISAINSSSSELNNGFYPICYHLYFAFDLFIICAMLQVAI